MPKQSYASRHDTAVLARPEPLALPAANAHAVDPPFNNRILRVTDPSISARSCWTTSAAAANAWNLDSTYFYFTQERGADWLARFDPATFHAVVEYRLPLDGCSFSYSDRELLYGTKQHKIYEYNIITRQARILVDLSAATGTAINHEARVTESQGWVMVSCGTSTQDQDIYCVLYRLSNGLTQVLNTAAGTLDGRPLDPRIGFRIHDAALVKGTPRYALITPAAGSDKYQTYVWDLTEEDFIYPIAVRDTGHTANGFGRRLNPAYNAGVKSAFLRGLAYAQVDSPAFHAALSNELVESHYSWNNSVGWAHIPVLGSTAQVNDGPWGYLAGEIFGISTDPTAPRVWRFCHNRSIWDGVNLGANFYDTPRGNVDQAGKYFLFSSNWLRTLGAGLRDERAGAYRSDVFLVELR